MALFRHTSSLSGILPRREHGDMLAQEKPAKSRINVLRCPDCHRRIYRLPCQPCRIEANIKRWRIAHGR